MAPNSGKSIIIRVQMSLLELLENSLFKTSISAHNQNIPGIIRIKKMIINSHPPGILNSNNEFIAFYLSVFSFVLVMLAKVFIPTLLISLLCKQVQNFVKNTDVFNTQCINI